MNARAPNSLATRIAMLVATAAGSACGAFVFADEWAGDSRSALLAATSIITLASAIAFRLATYAQRAAESAAAKEVRGPVDGASTKTFPKTSSLLMPRRRGTVLRVSVGPSPFLIW